MARRITKKRAETWVSDVPRGLLGRSVDGTIHRPEGVLNHIGNPRRLPERGSVATPRRRSDARERRGWRSSQEAEERRLCDVEVREPPLGVAASRPSAPEPPPRLAGSAYRFRE